MPLEQVNNLEDFEAFVEIRLDVVPVPGRQGDPGVPGTGSSDTAAVIAEVTAARSGEVSLTARLALFALASTAVTLADNQSISGIKTFVQPPIIPNASGPTNPYTKAQVDAIVTSLQSAFVSDASAVHKALTETITGDKTFSGAVNVPTPTVAAHAVTKAYADAVALTISNLVNVKGDLLAASADNTLIRVAAAADGRAVTYDSSTASGLGSAAIPSLTGLAVQAGSVDQFDDVTLTSPADQEVLRYDDGVNAWVNADLGTQFAGVDANGRLASAAFPQYYVPTLVLNEGDAIPAGTPTGTVILRRQITASIQPVLLGGVANTSGSVSTVLTLSATAADVAVGDYLIIGWFGSGETPTPTTFTIGITGGTGAVAAHSEIKHLQGSTSQAAIIYAKCTTLIPAGRGITLTVDDSRASMGMTVCKAGTSANVMNSTQASLVSTSVAGPGNTGTAISVSGGATSQASELAFMMTSFNPGATDQRTVAGTNGWTAMDVQRNSHGTNDRCGRLFYKELTSVATPALIGTATISNGTEPSNSVWTAVLASMKAA